MNHGKLTNSILTVAAIAVSVLGGPALAQDAGTPDKDQVVQQPEPYSPYVDQHFPQKVLFGDMHHHTSLSVDSGKPLAPMTWAQRLKRVFAIDIETCPECGGKLRVIACIEEPWLIRKIVAHIRLRDRTTMIQARAPPADPRRLLNLT